MLADQIKENGRLELNDAIADYSSGFKEYGIEDNGKLFLETLLV